MVGPGVDFDRIQITAARLPRPAGVERWRFHAGIGEGSPLAAIVPPDKDQEDW